MTETYRRLLRESGLPELEARILLEAAASRPRSWLLARLDENAENSVAQLARRLYARRHAGEPIAYITGEREFYSLELLISSDVLIPRPETELLVELALAHLPPQAGRAIDLGTGSGAVAIAIAKHAPDAEVWAVDSSPAALVMAERNAARHGVAVRFVRSDWLDEAPTGRFDLIVSNPPYVAEGDPHLVEGDLRFEPRAALVSGSDGLDAIRRIAHDAKTRLETGGWLLFEHGYDQAERCRDLLAAYGYDEIRSWKDLAGHARVSGGRLL
ncbi:MAG TPA: peptide chain release factor N(5)-glutamine methyltransferase [Burkholderiales bacterium]|nr:peptide chain release factor N(5)-glutamine methyltransferase [Burkholderiales bacterium]